MLNIFLIQFGKILSKLFRFFNLGDGSTWPGHIALNLNKDFVKQVLGNSRTKIIIVAGTNGKTTTASLIKTALKENGKTVFQNKSGANLLNGIASTLILNSNNAGKLTQDFAIFEIDENNLPLILKQTNPDFLLLLNLFRDQLDRYGEVDIVAEYWKESIIKLTPKTTIILNADDPQIAYLGKDLKTKIKYFGLQNSQFGSSMQQSAADSVYCPKCGNKLSFYAVAFSHLGNWKCPKCGLKRPAVESEKFAIYPLPGLYNKYNVLSATVALRQIGLTTEQINHAFTNFHPAFGRQEIIKYKDKNVQIFLSKNPTSFNQSFQTISELGAKTLLIVLNDRIPDGRDISWIWDIDFSESEEFEQIIVSGDRLYDMALRLKYELGIKNYEARVKTYEDLEKAIDEGVSLITESETLFILPTYSAMLEARKILTGRKIL